MPKQHKCEVCGVAIAGTDSGWSRCLSHPPTQQERDDMAYLVMDAEADAEPDWRNVGKITHYEAERRTR